MNAAIAAMPAIMPMVPKACASSWQQDRCLGVGSDPCDDAHDCLLWLPAK